MEENGERISEMEINNMKLLDTKYKYKINCINKINDNEKAKYIMNKKSKLYLFSKYI